MGIVWTGVRWSNAKYIVRSVVFCFLINADYNREWQTPNRCAVASNRFAMGIAISLVITFGLENRNPWTNENTTYFTNYRLSGTTNTVMSYLQCNADIVNSVLFSHILSIDASWQHVHVLTNHLYMASEGLEVVRVVCVCNVSALRLVGAIYCWFVVDNIWENADKTVNHSDEAIGEHSVI